MSDTQSGSSSGISSVASLRPLAVLSLLGEPVTDNAATRTLPGPTNKSVLAATVDQVLRSSCGDDVCILAWDDQLPSLANLKGRVRSSGPRRMSASLEETSAALRWSDGWRGGLLGKTTFDRGFDAKSIVSALDESGCDSAILIDAASAYIEPKSIDALIEHLEALPEQPYAFAPGAVGSGAMLLRRQALIELEKANRGPGTLTMYHPDRPVHDPIAKSFAVVVPPRVARSTARLTVDSDRQSRRLSLVQMKSVEAIVASLEAQNGVDPTPRDITLELTTRRATKPVWSMLNARSIDRPELTLEAARVIFKQLATIDDIRLTLAGVGDPLLHPQVIEIIAAARSAGIGAIHVETDLLPENASLITELAASNLDIISVHLPAAHAKTYTELMGVDRMRDVLENVKRFLLTRAQRASGVPILVPTFMKCEDNLGEMETWYDQWIRAVGCAVITGPSDFGGRIESVGVSDMTPGRRRPCRRLASRLTILSDGTIASCEEDILAEQSCGSHTRIADAWNDGLSMLRSLHAEHRWDESALCQNCTMWDRP